MNINNNEKDIITILKEEVAKLRLRTLQNERNIKILMTKCNQLYKYIEELKIKDNNNIPMSLSNIQLTKDENNIPIKRKKRFLYIPCC